MAVKQVEKQDVDFNPRSHKGSDNLCLPNPNVLCNFNPRSHKGSDVDRTILIEYADIFQSTLPQGERPFRSARSSVGCVFQSTLPQGERPSATIHLFIRTDISIHAPTRGATWINIIFEFIILFQSTLPQGERLLKERGWGIDKVFQSTLPQGERH